MQLLNVALTHFEDMDVLSMPDGTAKTYYSSKAYWALSMNLRAVNAVMTVKNKSTNAGVAVWWEYSWDGNLWFKSSVAVILEQTTAGSFRAEFANSSEIAPYGRLALQIRQPVSPTTTQYATVTLRALYKMEK